MVTEILNFFTDLISICRSSSSVISICSLNPSCLLQASGGPTRRSLPKMAVNFGKKTRERLSKSGKGGKSVNGGESWDGGGSVAEDGAETDSGVGADSELSSAGKMSNNGSTPHDLDSRTMQVSSV